MSQKVFIQVFIKSQADLPKEERFYYFHFRKNDSRERELLLIFYKLDLNYDEYYWTHGFDWYLQEKELPTEKEIEKAFPIKDLPVIQKEIDDNSESFWCQQGAKWYENWLMSKLK